VMKKRKRLLLLLKNHLSDQSNLTFNPAKHSQTWERIVRAPPTKTTPSIWSKTLWSEANLRSSPQNLMA
jgi:hypothetical protein